MNKQILFIQGGGDDGYTADKALVASLRKALGKGYTIAYPELKSDESQPDYGWVKQIAKQISDYNEDLIIVAHSFGASMLLKHLSENSVPKNITAVFLLATPFWKGDEDWQKGLMLEKDFAGKLPKDIPLFFYHCRDDEEVPFAQFEKYKKKIENATFHAIKTGGHQFEDALNNVVTDIKSL